MIWIYVLIFIASCLTLFWSGTWLVGALIRIARFLEWKEFVVAFFVMALAGSIPNLFIGINSALNQIPQLSFGDVLGGNIADLTLVVALAVLITKTVLPAESRLIQTTTIFTSAVAILPLLLILDGTLGRGDGLILIFTFIFYIFWLFSKEERFKKIYDDEKLEVIKEFKAFLKDLGVTILVLILILVAAEGIVRSAFFFSKALNLPLAIIGILIVGLGNALPEGYFTIVSARAGQTRMILGNLMGAVIVPATLVLGIVGLICPVKIFDFTPYAIARIFLILSAFFFLIIVRTGQKITKIEALALLSIYILFLIAEIASK